MDYGITKLVMGQTPFILITEVDYYAIKTAKNNLIEAYYLEQKIDLVMEDYLEFEMTLLSKAAQHMMFHDFKYVRMQNDVNDINRRIINLLSACRMYLDHYIHHLRNIYGENTEKIETVRGQVRLEYDSNLSYRVLEALRNYVQHRGFPIQSVSFNAHRDEKSDKDSQIEFTVTPSLNVKELEEDKRFKKSVIDDLKKIGEQFDFKPFVRDYITSIVRIHMKVREVLKSDILSWESSIQNCIGKFKDASSTEDVVGLGIAVRDEEGLYPDMVPIFADFIDHRQGLEQKNSFIGSLKKFYVSNKILK